MNGGGRVADAGGTPGGSVPSAQATAPRVTMNLRFSARGDNPEAMVHLTVVETFRFGAIVRRRGEALCRPKTSLPNLESLTRQLLGSRRCCAACIDTMAKIRLSIALICRPPRA